MAKTLQDELVAIAPYAQLLFPLGGALALLTTSLPRVAFAKAIGPAPALRPDATFDLTYDTYSKQLPFVSTLVEAVYTHNTGLFVTYFLIVATIAAFYIARSYVGQQPSKSSRRYPLVLTGLFGLLMLIAALSYPRFTAPLYLSNLFTTLDAQEAILEVPRLARPHYRELYSLFFGVVSVQPTTDDEPVPRLPNITHVRQLQRHYYFLALITIWTLLLLVCATLLSSVPHFKGKSRFSSAMVGAGIIVLTFAHLSQWTMLVKSYGQLLLTSAVLESAVLVTPDDPEVEMWPFNRLELVYDSFKDDVPVAIHNYWPFRPSESAALRLLCGTGRGAKWVVMPVDQPSAESMNAAVAQAPPRRRSGPSLTIFPVTLGRMLATCETRPSDIELHDGFGAPARRNEPTK